MRAREEAHQRAVLLVLLVLLVVGRHGVRVGHVGHGGGRGVAEDVGQVDQVRLGLALETPEALAAAEADGPALVL